MTDKPVAWRCVGGDGVSDVTQREDIADQWVKDGLSVYPLYPASAIASLQEENERLRGYLDALAMNDAGYASIKTYEARAQTLTEEIAQQEKRLRASVLDNASLREENERLKRERDALFSHTGCECDKDECCRYLVQHISRYEAAEARVSELEARLAEAMKVVAEFMDITEPASQPAFKDPDYGDEVERLGDRIGYGALISSASASWREADVRRYGRSLGGEFVVGPCMSVLLGVRKMARAFVEGSKHE